MDIQMNATSTVRIIPRILSPKAKKPTCIKVSRMNLSLESDDDYVFILVFDHGNFRNGVYSLQERTKDDIPENTVLAFHSREDALRYGMLLDTSMGQIPNVEMTHSSTLKKFCSETGHKCMIVSPRAFFMPPTKSVKVTDCERSRALRRDEWTVQDPEIESQRQMLSRMFEMDSDDHF